MGLPDGWVTDPHYRLTTNQQLAALGNGVLPAQGVHALRELLARCDRANQVNRGHLLGE